MGERERQRASEREKERVGFCIGRDYYLVDLLEILCSEGDTVSCIDHYTLAICYFPYFFYIIFILGPGQVFYAAWQLASNQSPANYYCKHWRTFSASTCFHMYRLLDAPTKIHPSKPQKLNLRSGDLSKLFSKPTVSDYYVASFGKTSLSASCSIIKNLKKNN